MFKKIDAGELVVIAVVVVAAVIGVGILVLQGDSPITGGGAGSTLQVFFEDGDTMTYDGFNHNWLNIFPQTITSTIKSDTPVTKVVPQSKYALRIKGDATQIQEWSITGTQTVAFDDGTVEKTEIALGTNKSDVLDATGGKKVVAERTYQATALESHSLDREGRHHMRIHTEMTITIKWRDGTTSTKASSNEVDWQYDYKKAASTTTGANQIESFTVTSSGSPTWQ